MTSAPPKKLAIRYRSGISDTSSGFGYVVIELRTFTQIRKEDSLDEHDI